MQHVGSTNPIKASGRSGGRGTSSPTGTRRTTSALPLDRVPATGSGVTEPEEVTLAIARAVEAATGSCPEAPASLESIQAVVQQLLVLMTQASVPLVWTVEDIATWLKLPKGTAKLYVVTRRDFPAPLRPTGKKDGQRRYFAADVIAWARTAAKGDE